MRPPQPPATNSSSVLYCCINLARSRCRRRQHGARQLHRPALVHLAASVVDMQLHHAANTRRHRRGRYNVAPPANLHTVIVVRATRSPPSLAPLPEQLSLPRRRLHGGYDAQDTAAAQSNLNLGLSFGRYSEVDRRDLGFTSGKVTTFEGRHRFRAGPVDQSFLRSPSYTTKLRLLRIRQRAKNRNLHRRDFHGVEKTSVVDSRRRIRRSDAASGEDHHPAPADRVQRQIEIRSEPGGTRNLLSRSHHHTMRWDLAAATAPRTASTRVAQPPRCRTPRNPAAPHNPTVPRRWRCLKGKKSRRRPAAQALPGGATDGGRREGSRGGATSPQIGRASCRERVSR